MEFIARHWKSRTLTILFLSTLISLLVWSLEFTDWAATVSSLPQNDEHGERPPGALMMVLPFVKVLVLMTVPAVLVVAVRAFSRGFYRLLSKAK